MGDTTRPGIVVHYWKLQQDRIDRKLDRYLQKQLGLEEYPEWIGEVGDIYGRICTVKR